MKFLQIWLYTSMNFILGGFLISLICSISSKFIQQWRLLLLPGTRANKQGHIYPNRPKLVWKQSFYHRKLLILCQCCSVGEEATIYAACGADGPRFERQFLPATLSFLSFPVSLSAHFPLYFHSPLPNKSKKPRKILTQEQWIGI